MLWTVSLSMTAMDVVILEAGDMAEVVAEVMEVMRIQVQAIQLTELIYWIPLILYHSIVGCIGPQMCYCYAVA